MNWKRFCLACLLLAALSVTAVAAERFVMVLQYPPDQKVLLTLYRTGAIERIEGEAEIKREFKHDRITKVAITIKDTTPPPDVKPGYASYVAWLVDAKGGFTRVGAFEGKEVKFETPMIAFGIVISLETDAAATAPKGLFVMESQFPDKKNSFFGMIKVVYTHSAAAAQP